MDSETDDENSDAVELNKKDTYDGAVVVSFDKDGDIIEQKGCSNSPYTEMGSRGPTSLRGRRNLSVLSFLFSEEHEEETSVGSMNLFKVQKNFFLMKFLEKYIVSQ